MARDVRRSIPSVLWLLGCAAAVVTLPAVAMQNQMDPPPATRWNRPSHPTALYWTGAVGAAIAISLERRVRRQLELARDGILADGIIDGVEPSAWQSDCWIARYRFGPTDHPERSGQCFVSEGAALTLQTGSRVTVYYDKADPRCSVLEEGLTLIAWRDA